MLNRFGDEVEPNRLQPSDGPAPPTGKPGLSGRDRIVLLAGLALASVAIVGIVAMMGAPMAPAPSPSAALPSFMAGGFPHEDLALEGRMPRSVGDLQLKVWSVRGEQILEVQGGSDLPAVLTRLGRSVEDVSYAIAGRSADTEPPNWTFAYRIEGLSGEAIRHAFQAVNLLPSPPFETRTIAGRTVLVADGGTGDSAAIAYAAADAYFVFSAPDLSSALAMLRQVGRGSGQ
jgi:hypothetical protein